MTGEFVIRDVPSSTCGQGGLADGYYFEDDAGLQFDNHPGFIDQSYSLAFNFQVDEFISPPPWVRILSFTHVDDIGVYIKLTNPPTNGTLEFWPYGTVGELDFFTTVDFYQMILVRNNEGLIKIYINGEEFAEYDDSNSLKFVPGDPDNYIVFFKDHPSVLAGEASPGFVSDIIITNYAWTPDSVLQVWENFCSSLLQIDNISENKFSIFPNPAQDVLYVSFEKANLKPEIQFYDIMGKRIDKVKISENRKYIDISSLNKGMYFL
ncbi:MAG: T9SS type A sorting domain-containing protein [Bacteroidales bacterium]|nr:T9SS type A sorting domain-containing protein [Bacteroidales bacterium]